MTLMPEALLLRKMYQDIVLTKHFNGRMVELKDQKKIPGPVHQTEGQEAVGVGVVAALRSDDYLVSYYRGMAEWLSKGMDLEALAAEMLGKVTGVCQGKGGEMSLADGSINLMGASGIIGGSLPSGVGVALAAKLYKKGQVAAVFFGEGAANTGAFHEALNMAAVLKVPGIFVCLNNQYAISTYVEDAMAVPAVADRAASYNMPGYTVDGNDAVAVYEVAREAVERARSGGGPSLIEGKTYRIGGHSSTNPEIDFMVGDVEEWRSRDPLILLKGRLLDGRLATRKELENMEEEIAARVKDAVERALNAPFPPSEAALQGMFI